MSADEAAEIEREALELLRRAEALRATLPPHIPEQLFTQMPEHLRELPKKAEVDRKLGSGGATTEQVLPKNVLLRSNVEAGQTLGPGDTASAHALLASSVALGFWENADTLNLVATFLDGRSIAAVACSCRFAHDNLCDPAQLRWLAELRGLDPAKTHITSLEHIEIAEAMASLETSIGFARGDVRVKEEAIPSIKRVVDMLLRHTAFKLAIEAHCGLDASPEFALHFARRRALSVRRKIGTMAPVGALTGRLITRSWGNSRPLIWASSSVDEGRRNARVEVYLIHNDFELPRR